MNDKKQSRMTKQRRVILEEVKKLKTHPTADELYEIVRERLPRISLGTVYRNLDVLSESGEIGKLETSGSQYRFDGNTDNHHHVRCVCCGRIDDVEGVSVQVPEAMAGGAAEYDIVGHRLEFLGICPGCKETRRSMAQGREAPNV